MKCTTQEVYQCWGIFIVIEITVHPDNHFDLSLLQLIRECKEVMLASVMVKQYYMFMVGSVDEENFEVELEGFEEDFKNMLEVRNILVIVCMARD